MSGGDNKGNNQTFLRSTVIGTLNSWINDISSGSLFQNFNNLLNFRRRQSKPPSSSFTILPFFSRSTSSDEIDHAAIERLEDESMDTVPAKLLNGTLIPTLKTKEVIELANFGVVELDNCEQGIGHLFVPHELKTPTWCDSCGQFIWTPVIYDSNKTYIRLVSPFSRTLQCEYCKYICHIKCRKLVHVDCKGIIESPALTNFDDINEIFKTHESDDQELEELEKKIKMYNEKLNNKGSGLGMTLLPNSKAFRGFIRVHINLTRPISVIAGTRPPSIYDIINEEDTVVSRRTLTVFYMPRETVKSIHITSNYTTLDVIKAMLKKFKVVDNPQKFALYRRQKNHDGKAMLSRIGDQDFPLKIALEWFDWNERQFVLQENDTGDIVWDYFLLPELKNFLIMLDREEEEHLSQLKLKYEALRQEINHLISIRSIQNEGVPVT